MFFFSYFLNALHGRDKTQTSVQHKQTRRKRRRMRRMKEGRGRGEWPHLHIHLLFVLCPLPPLSSLYPPNPLPPPPLSLSPTCSLPHSEHVRHLVIRVLLFCEQCARGCISLLLAMLTLYRLLHPGLNNSFYLAWCIAN